MKLSRRLFLSTAAGFAAAPRWAAAKERGPGDFAFLTAGKTTRAEVLRRLGKPEIDTTTFILAGEIDPFQNPPSEAMLYNLHDRAGRDGKVIEVPLLGYQLPDWPLMNAMLLFKDDGTLLYGLVPIGPSEQNLDKLVERYGKYPRTSEFTQRVGDVIQFGKFYWFDAHTIYFGFKDDQIWERIVF